MLKTAAVYKILSCVLRRSMACAAVHSLLIAVFVVLFTTVTEGSPDRPLRDSIEVAFILVLILFLGLLLLYGLIGMFGHVPAVQKLGFEPTPGNLSPYQSRAVTVRGGSAYAIGRARRILQETDGVRIIEQEPNGTRVRAVRKAHDDAGYAQLIEITANPSEGASNVDVRSRPRFRLAPFDRGQNLVNVENIAAELGSP
ncbi:hypothetical protein ACIQMV_35320 [Streptomyces sp. NPDC091412]|uniref:hypothetical protein n=1 Tax=Streptomyces sp. NPDC091412 TaxID=3366002 RepID=UPI0038263AE2